MHSQEEGLRACPYAIPALVAGVIKKRLESPLMEVFWAYLLKPFIIVAVLLLVYPARIAVERYMQDGKLKRYFLRRI